MKFKITFCLILIVFLMLGCAPLLPSISTAHLTATLAHIATINNTPTATPSNTPEPTVMPFTSRSMASVELPVSTIDLSLTPAPTLFVNDLDIVQVYGLKVSNIRAISIQDDWTGLSNVAPVLSYYSLLPNGAEFTGLVNFDVGGYSKEGHISEVQDLHIPAKDIQLFLDKLETISMREGEYHSTIQWTDDYPGLKIRIDLDYYDLTFYTSSQGPRHTPWGMSYFNQTYIIDSDTPMDALDILLPYLKKDRLRALEDQVDGTYTPTPRPTP